MPDIGQTKNESGVTWVYIGGGEWCDKARVSADALARLKAAEEAATSTRPALPQFLALARLPPRNCISKAEGLRCCAPLPLSTRLWLLRGEHGC